MSKSKDRARALLGAMNAAHRDELERAARLVKDAAAAARVQPSVLLAVLIPRQPAASRPPRERGTVITSGDACDIVEYAKEGRDIKWIASEYGISAGRVRNIIAGREWSSATGVKYNPARRVVQQHDEELIAKMREDGATCLEIAEHTGVSLSSVECVVSTLGLPLAPVRVRAERMLKQGVPPGKVRARTRASHHEISQILEEQRATRESRGEP